MTFLNHRSAALMLILFGVSISISTKARADLNDVLSTDLAGNVCAGKSLKASKLATMLGRVEQSLGLSYPSATALTDQDRSTNQKSKDRLAMLRAYYEADGDAEKAQHYLGRYAPDIPEAERLPLMRHLDTTYGVKLSQLAIEIVSLKQNYDDGYDQPISFTSNKGEDGDSFVVAAAFFGANASDFKCSYFKTNFLARKTVDDLTKEVAKADGAELSFTQISNFKENSDTKEIEQVNSTTVAINATLGYAIPLSENKKASNKHHLIIFGNYQLNDVDEEFPDRPPEPVSPDDEDKNREESFSLGAIYKNATFIGGYEQEISFQATYTEDLQKKSKIGRFRATYAPYFGSLFSLGENPSNGVIINGRPGQLFNSDIFFAPTFNIILERNEIFKAGDNEKFQKVVESLSGPDLLPETREADNYFGAGFLAGGELTIEDITLKAHYRKLFVPTAIVDDQAQFVASFNIAIPKIDNLAFTVSYTNGDDPDSLIDLEQFKIGFGVKF